MFPKKGPILDKKEQDRLDCRKGLSTNLDHGRYTERLKREDEVLKDDVKKSMGEHPNLHSHNSYLGLFRREDWVPMPEYKYALDKIMDETPFDPKCHRDSHHPFHLRRLRGEVPKYAMTESQKIGRLPPLEDFSTPHGRTKALQDDSMDKSHLRTAYARSF